MRDPVERSSGQRQADECGQCMRKIERATERMNEQDGGLAKHSKECGERINLEGSIWGCNPKDRKTENNCYLARHWCGNWLITHNNYPNS